MPLWQKAKSVLFTFLIDFYKIAGKCNEQEVGFSTASRFRGSWLVIATRQGEVTLSLMMVHMAAAVTA